MWLDPAGEHGEGANAEHWWVSEISGQTAEGAGVFTHHSHQSSCGLHPKGVELEILVCEPSGCLSLRKTPVTGTRNEAPEAATACGTRS